MSVEAVLAGLTATMRGHLDQLQGDLGAASAAGDTLTRARDTLQTVHDDHRAAADAMTATWYGGRADDYAGRFTSMQSSLTTLTTNAGTAGGAATEAVGLVEGGRTGIQGLIDRFIAEARPVLDGAMAAQQGGTPGVVMQAVARLQGVVGGYDADSAAALEEVRSGLTGIRSRLDGATPVPGLAGMDGSLGMDTSMPAVTGGQSAGTGVGAAPPPSMAGAPAGSDGSGSSGGGSGGGGGGGSGSGGGGGGGGDASKPRLPMAIPPQPGDGVGINLPDGSSSEAPNEIAAAAVRAALSNLGVPYVWGGTAVGQGLDCSGLTMTSYAAAGFEIPRHSAAQAVGAEVPSADQMLPGDLIVWDGHVAMYIGNGQIVEAGDPVQTGPVRTSNSGMPFLGFYRPTG